MDIHRSRFVPYPVHPITAVAFTRTSDEPLPDGVRQPTLRLALGRDSGHIEIWNPLGGKWVQESVFQGDGVKSIDGLLWTREPDDADVEGRLVLGQYRLFSISSSPHVVEWDLERGKLKQRSSGNFSEVWCFAAQPQTPSGKGVQKSQDIVAGCGDGNIVLLSTGDGDVQFQRFLARASGKKARCICITYQTQDRIVAGSADGNLRLIDTRNGSILRTMNLGVSSPSGPKIKFAWKLKCLPNRDIVAGDSSGDVTFWDGRSYSLIQRIEGHDSDCIDIVSSSDGKTIFTGNLEGKVAVYHNNTNPSGRKSWSRIHQRRIHAKSEVKALAAYDGRDMSVVVSGGSDLVPTVIPLRQYGKENLRTLPHLPQLSPVTSARQARLVVSWWEKTVHIWRISRQQDIGSSLGLQPSRKLVARLVLNSKHSIRHVAISIDGKVLAASTDAEVKVFCLRKRADTEMLDVRLIKVPDALAHSGARILQFAPNGKWLAAVDATNEVQIVRVAAVPDKPNRIQILDRAVELEKQHRPASSQSAFKNYEQTLNRLAFSPDSCVLVASDLSGHLESWVLEGHEDPTAAPIDITTNDSKEKDSDDDGSSDDSSDDDEELCIFYGQHWADNPVGHLLPRLDSAPLVLTFRPTRPATSALVNGNPGVHPTRSNPHAHSHELPKGQHTIWIMTAQHQMYEIDVLEGRLSDWSRRNPTSVLPEDFTKLRDRVAGAVWDVSSQHERLWLHGSNWIFMLDVGQDHGQTSSKKRRHSHTAADTTIPKKQKTSGAGSKVHQAERHGISGLISRYEDGVSTNVDLDRQIIQTEDFEEDDLDHHEDFRPIRPTGTDEAQGSSGADSQTTSSNRKWWCTFKFRPILGVVPLDDDDDIAEDENRPVEVAVVERPVWDIQDAGEAVRSK